MVPQYKPVHRLAKTALKGYEKQEKLAKNMNTFKFTSAQNKPAPMDDPGMNDIESLLGMVEDIENTAMAPVKKGSKK
jgi:hypothetical protein